MTSLPDFRDRAARLRWRIQPFIAGAAVASSGREMIDNIDPSSETVLCTFSAGSMEDVDRAVRVARARFRDGCWAGLSPATRAAALRRLADLICRNSESLALLDSLEMGKPISAAIQETAALAPNLLREWARLAEQLGGESAPRHAGTISYNTLSPRGVVGAITPWNFPTLNAIVKVGPALAAGNTVVLKPSEIAPSPALRIAELAIEAGIPEGVFNVVPGGGATVGAALALHADVDMISFTGSTATGRRIMEMAGRSNGKAVLLECGGKSPQVVFADVEDIDFVAREIAAGFLTNQGQVCSAGTRLVVDESIHDLLVAKVVEHASARRPGHPLDPGTSFGPLASPAQRDRVGAHVQGALKSGVRAALLGTIQQAGGCFVEPTVFVGVEPTAAIAREEIFGPVLCVHAFAGERAAIEIANATDFGLAATVWTTNLGRASRLADAIDAGAVTVRTGAAENPEPAPSLSYEPSKASGFGCEEGLRGLQSYTRRKLVSLMGL